MVSPLREIIVPELHESAESVDVVRYIGVVLFVACADEVANLF